MILNDLIPYAQHAQADIAPDRAIYLLAMPCTGVWICGGLTFGVSRRLRETQASPEREGRTAGQDSRARTASLGSRLAYLYFTLMFHRFPLFPLCKKGWLLLCSQFSCISHSISYISRLNVHPVFQSRGWGSSSLHHFTHHMSRAARTLILLSSLRIHHRNISDIPRIHACDPHLPSSWTVGSMKNHSFHLLDLVVCCTLHIYSIIFNIIFGYMSILSSFSDLFLIYNEDDPLLLCITLPTSCSLLCFTQFHNHSVWFTWGIWLHLPLSQNKSLADTYKKSWFPKSRSNDFTTLSLCPSITVLIAVMPPYAHRFSSRTPGFIILHKHLILLQIVFLHNSTPGLQGESRDWLKHVLVHLEHISHLCNHTLDVTSLCTSFNVFPSHRVSICLSHPYTKRLGMCIIIIFIVIIFFVNRMVEVSRRWPKQIFFTFRSRKTPDRWLWHF